MRVLITRPFEDAAPLGEAVRKLGHEPVYAPLSDIRYPATEAPPGAPAATIFTSRNAIRALENVDWAASLRGYPAYCVGAATAEEARDAGFHRVVAGGGTGAQLAEHIASTHEPGDGPLLYLTGEHLAFDLEEALGARGFTVWRRIVYRNELVESLALPVTVGLQKDFFDAMIFMSPRTAAHFVRLAQDAGVADPAGRLAFYCLSQNVADALAPLDPARVAVAHRPTRDAVLDLLRPSNVA